VCARTWANELRGRGIRVDTVTSGPTDTPALAGLTPDAVAFQRQLAARVPLGRIARAATGTSSCTVSFVTAATAG
jgi:NAD(P)-dependent dehydrogenase (short-subunit alcohol dehydrogenase family)